MTHFGGSGIFDRPLRDLTALGFFPALEDVKVSRCDLADLSPLASLRRVKRLSIGEYSELVSAHELDFALGEKPPLECLHLALRQIRPAALLRR